MSQRDTPEWQSAVDRALEEAGHGVHGGYDVTADGIIVCAMDGEPVADARTVAILDTDIHHAAAPDHMPGDGLNMEVLTIEEHRARHEGGK